MNVGLRVKWLLGYRSCEGGAGCDGQISQNTDSTNDYAPVFCALFIRKIRENEMV